jgi:NADH-quinone oxidoreductase subunit M
MANRAWAVWAIPGVVLGAAYLLWLYQRVFFGPVTNPKNEKLLDLTPRELATFVPLIILAFAIGLYPKPLFRVLDQPVTEMVQRINSNGYYNAAAPALTAPVAAPKTEAKSDALAPTGAASSSALTTTASLAQPAKK